MIVAGKKKATAKKKVANLSDPLASPGEWISLIDEAYVRVKAAHHGSGALAIRRLMQHLRAGDLPSGYLIIGHDEQGRDKEQFHLLTSSEWDGLMLTDTLIMTQSEIRPGGIAVRVLGSGRRYLRDPLFVSRKHFDALYPTKAAEQTDKSSNRPPRGKDSIKNWRLVVARELIRRAGAKETWPTAKAMVLFCGDKLDYSPDEADMLKLLNFLRGI